MITQRLTAIVLALFVALTLTTLPTVADPGNGHGNSGKHNNKKDKDNDNQEYKAKDHKGKKAQNTADSLISVNVSYNNVRPLAVNHGITGYQALPPGIAKNLARGKPLPPGIARKSVPASLLRELPVYPGYEWRIVGNDLVLVALSTAIIASVINGVFD